MLAYVRWFFNFFGGNFVFNLLGLFLLFKLYQRIGRCKCMCKCHRLMLGKTVLITDGNSDIGKETARNVAKRGARVLIACKTISEGEKTKEKIQKETGNVHIHVLELDVSSLQSVRKFAGYLNRTERCLDVLIHNAGVEISEPIITGDDSSEVTMATNHYGPYLLTHLLIDLLKQAKQGRIIVVTSGYYYLSCIYDLSNKSNPVNHFFSSMQNFLSNYATIYFTLELARRLKGTGVTANCVHPGIVNTALFRNVLDGVSWYAKIFHFLFSKTPQKGARSVIRLAVNHNLRKVTGKYFADRKMEGLANGAADQEYGQKFRYISEMLMNLPRGNLRAVA